jgi:hypothetical protein
MPIANSVAINCFTGVDIWLTRTLGTTFIKYLPEEQGEKLLRQKKPCPRGRDRALHWGKRETPKAALNLAGRRGTCGVDVCVCVCVCVCV